MVFKSVLCVLAVVCSVLAGVGAYLAAPRQMLVPRALPVRAGLVLALVLAGMALWLFCQIAGAHQRVCAGRGVDERMVFPAALRGAAPTGTEGIMSGGVRKFNTEQWFSKVFAAVLLGALLVCGLMGLWGCCVIRMVVRARHPVRL